jgi:type IV secretory pathway TraG/TraD family ATPase VirD4
MGRSKGGFLVLANQDLGSVSNVYGQDQKETFFNNFNVHLTVRLNDPTTAEFLSKAFGEREVIKKYRSSSFSPNDVGDRFTFGEQEKLEKIILPTEFQSLPDFHTFLKISNYGTSYMKTKRKFLKVQAKEFDQKSFSLTERLNEPSANHDASKSDKNNAVDRASKNNPNNDAARAIIKNSREDYERERQRARSERIANEKAYERHISAKNRNDAKDEIAGIHERKKQINENISKLEKEKENYKVSTENQ